MKRLEDGSQLKTDSFAFLIIITLLNFADCMLLMHDNGKANSIFRQCFQKLSKLVFFHSAYNAHCTFMQFYPVKIFMRRQGWRGGGGGGGGGGLVKCSLTFIFECLVKRGAYFKHEEILI